MMYDAKKYYCGNCKPEFGLMKDHTLDTLSGVYVGTANSYYSRVNNLKDVFMNNSKNINSGAI